MAKDTPLSQGQLGFAVGASVIGGIFEGLGQNALNRAAFKIQESQNRINQMFAEQEYQDQMLVLMKNAQAQRDQIAAAGMEAAQKKRQNLANIRVARAEGGGTNELEDAMLEQEAKHSQYYQGLLANLQSVELQTQLQKAALLNDKFRVGLEGDMALAGMSKGGGIGDALGQGLGGGLQTFFNLAAYTNWTK